MKRILLGVFAVLVTLALWAMSALWYISGDYKFARTWWGEWLHAHEYGLAADILFWYCLVFLVAGLLIAPDLFSGTVRREGGVVEFRLGRLWKGFATALFIPVVFMVLGAVGNFFYYGGCMTPGQVYYSSDYDYNDDELLRGQGLSCEGVQTFDDRKTGDLNWTGTFARGFGRVTLGFQVGLSVLGAIALACGVMYFLCRGLWALFLSIFELRNSTNPTFKPMRKIPSLLAS